MENRTDLRSQALDLLRFPLAVVILTVHVFGTGVMTVHGVEYSLENIPVMSGVMGFINAFLKNQSVPIYFFISGYVFFIGDEFTKDVYVRKLKNRIKTLLIPYIIWNTAAILMQAALFLPYFRSLLSGLAMVETDWSFTGVLQCYWNLTKGVFAALYPDAGSLFPQNVPLWFIRDLMIVVLCTPLIYRFLKWARNYAVWLFGVSWFVLNYWQLGHVLQLSAAFFFFSWGAYVSITKKDMLEYFGRFFKVSLVAYPLLSLLYVASVHWCPEITDTIKRLNVVAGLFFAYNVSAWLLKHNVCKVSAFLASASFFVYVTHALIYTNLLKLLFYLLRPVTQLEVISVYIFVVLIALASILSVFYLLHRYAPPILKIMTGRK